MINKNTSDSVKHIPLLSEEMDRTLHLLARRDEVFREALIADSKGVIQQVFRQRLPEGNLPDDLTIKVIEQDPYTHHIVLPALPDQFPAMEVPEEAQIELIAYRSSEMVSWNCATRHCDNTKSGCKYNDKEISKGNGSGSKQNKALTRALIEGQSRSNKDSTNNQIEAQEGWSKGKLKPER